MTTTLEVPTLSQDWQGALIEPRQLLVLEGVDWNQYQAISGALQDRPGLRLTYDSRSLEIMTTSTPHEMYKKLLGRFLETLAEEFELRIATAGSMTFQVPELAKGLEPDDCYWIANVGSMRTIKQWHPKTDPPPDVVLEIEISRTIADRKAIYAALRVPELWCFDGQRLRVLILGSQGTYEVSERSPTFPSIPIEDVSRFLQPGETDDFLGMVRTFREWVRNNR